jgi:hypothetical protein
MSRPAFLPRFSRHMAERQGRVQQGAEDKRARDFEFAPKLRLRRTVHFETTVHSRDGCQGKYGTVPDFRRAAAPVRSQRTQVGEAAGSCCDGSRRVTAADNTAEIQRPTAPGPCTP